jgi:hypothetical protein
MPSSIGERGFEGTHEKLAGPAGGAHAGADESVGDVCAGDAVLFAPEHGGSDSAPQRRPFVALVATMVGALSCLVVLAQWFPQWVLSPCAS